MQAHTRGANEEDPGYWGAFSDVAKGTTLDGIPGKPTNLRRITRNETCVSLAWEPPLESNGQIIKYVVGYVFIVHVHDCMDTLSNQFIIKVISQITSESNGSYHIYCRMPARRGLQ